jgi:hypothetical protein
VDSARANVGRGWAGEREGRSEQPGLGGARRHRQQLASFGTWQRQGRRRADEGEAEVGDAAVAVVEGERGPRVGRIVVARAVGDVAGLLGVVLVVIVVGVIDARRLVMVVVGTGMAMPAVVRVRMAVLLGRVVVVEVDRQGERGAAGPVGMVRAVTRQVAHRSEDPAEHEDGELDDGGLMA